MVTRAIDIDENRVYRAVIRTTDKNTNKVETTVFGPYGRSASAKGKVTEAVKRNESNKRWYPGTWFLDVEGEVQVIEGTWKTV